MADDGNYSIQVLQEALKGFGNLICAPIEKKDVKASIQDYSAEEAVSNVEVAELLGSLLVEEVEPGPHEGPDRNDVR